MPRWTATLRTLTLVAACALVAASCGGDDDSDAAAGGDTTRTVADATTSTVAESTTTAPAVTIATAAPATTVTTAPVTTAPPATSARPATTRVAAPIVTTATKAPTAKTKAPTGTTKATTGATTATTVPAATTTTAKADLKGTVVIDGSSTVGPMTEVAAVDFMSQNPKVQVVVGISGTGGGFEKFCNGETDINDASRVINATEVARCASKGIAYEELQVANDGISLVVNKDNTWVDCLTVAEIKKIWEPAAQGNITNWNQVRAGFPDQKLDLYGAGTDSGTFDTFTTQINGRAGVSRSDYTATEDDNVTVKGVSSSKGALGYFGFSYYEENASKIKLLSVDSGSGCVAPSVESVQNNTYKPLSRPLFIYPKKDLLKRAEGLAFVLFYESNVDNIAKKARFIPMTAAQKAAIRTKIENLQK